MKLSHRLGIIGALAQAARVPGWRRLASPLAGGIVLGVLAGCGGAGDATSTGGTNGSTGGTSVSTGGTSAATGGSPGSGGALGAQTGGATGASGGATASGGAPSGGTTGVGGITASGAGGAIAPGSGGALGGGGQPVGSGGRVGSGGTAGAPGGSQAGGNGAGGSAGQSSTGGAKGTGGSPNTGGPSYPYIFSVFNDAQVGKTTLIIYTSNDALNFTLLYDTKFGGPTGTLRDPSIMKHTDGKFYIAFTTPPDAGCCGPESSFAIASSANLKDWTTVTTVPSGVAGVKNTWAPEWFKDKDGSIYAIVNVDGKTYRYKAMNDSLTMFSGPTWIGIGPGYIDTFILTIGDTYHAFTKNMATYIEHATSTSLDGPWTFVGMNNWAGWGTHKEAGALIQLADGTWRFFCDAGSTGHEMYSDSKDIFQTWTAPKTLPNVGNNISHGTVIKGN